MSEPVSTKTSVALLALLGVSAGPIAGDWSMVLMGSLIGAAWHMSVNTFDSMAASFRRFGACVLISMGLTQFATPVLVHHIGATALVDPAYALLAVATVVAVAWRPVWDFGMRFLASKGPQK